MARSKDPAARLSQIFEGRQHAYQTESDRRMGKLADMLGCTFECCGITGVLTRYDERSVTFTSKASTTDIRLAQDQFWHLFGNGHITKG